MTGARTLSIVWGFLAVLMSASPSPGQSLDSPSPDLGPHLDPGDFVARFLPAVLAERRAREADRGTDEWGDDTALEGYNETTIAVNPLDRENIACASLFELRVSTNGGVSWSPTVPARAADGYFQQGDPSVAFDRQGRLFWATLASPLAAHGPGGGLEIFIQQCNPLTGEFIGAPVNVSAQAGVPASAGHANDKEWMAIDTGTASPFAGRLYMAWMNYPPGGGSAPCFTYSSDHGTTWAPAVQLGSYSVVSGPVHVTTAPNGDVYVAIHRQPGHIGGRPDGISGYVHVYRSTDGGATFPQESLAFGAGDADITFNRQTLTGTIPGTRFLLLGSRQPWVFCDPHVAGRIYVLANDDPDNDLTAGDAANVYLATSMDFGVTWSAPARVDNGPGTSFQVMPTAAIDPVTGAIVVSYYDNRRGLTNAAGNYLLDTFTTVSVDGGVTFQPDVQVNDRPFDPDAGSRCRYDCGPLLFDVWTASATRAFAVAVTGNILSYNGTSWSLLPGTTSVPKFGVWGSSPTNVFTCGAGGQILRYTGTLLLTQNSQTTQDLHSIDGRAGTDIFAVGANGTVVHYNGVAWSVMASGTTEHLQDVWANPSGATFIVGDHGKVLRYDGSWSDISIPGGESLYAVWGASDSDIWACGMGGALYHWTGTWISAPSIGVMTGLWGTGAGEMLGAGFGRIYRFDGTGWSSEETSENEVIRLHGSAPNNVFAVGENGYIAHFDGSTWTSQPNPLVPTNPTLRIGEYNGVAVDSTRAYATWSGNTFDGALEPLDQQNLVDAIDLDIPTGISIVRSGWRSSGPQLELPVPNPAAREIRVGYSLALEGTVNLSLFDASGRRVATLFDGRQAAGRHLAEWQGLERADGAPASGVYFLRLTANGTSQAQRVVLIR